MIVLNLYGSPGSGKSTTCAFIFSYLKNKNVNVEMTREWAKEVVYEGSYHKLENQLYVTAKQYKRLKDIDSNKKENVQLVITDSPLLLGKYYGRHSPYYKELCAIIDKVNSEFENIDVFVRRVKPYNPHGRMQNEEQSDEISKFLLDLIPYNFIINGEPSQQEMLAKIIYDKCLEKIGG